MNTILQRLQDEKRVKRFIISYYIIGFAGMAFPLTKPYFEQLTGLTILISFGLMMLYHQGWTLKFILAAIFIYAAGFAVEAFGVSSGSVFGHYSYHTSLGPKWFDTPLLIGINWLMLIYAIFLLTSKIKLHRLLRPLFNAALMVVYDLLLEPVAIEWNMWKWKDLSVPLQNYIAWFVIALIFFVILQILNVRYKNRISSLILICQCVLFLLLNMVIILLSV